MYDYYYNQWGTFNGVNVISSCLYNGMHAVLDAYGRVGQAIPGQYLDFGVPVLLSLTTGWLNLAGVIGYQRIYEFLLQLESISPYKINIQAAYDYNPVPSQSGLLTVNGISGYVPSGFGDPIPVGTGSAEFPARIHTKRQLSRSIQISLTEVFDASQGIPVAGAGFTLSSLTLWVGIKKGKYPIKAANAIGLT
jgi:hypothetical protein